MGGRSLEVATPPRAAWCAEVSPPCTPRKGFLPAARQFIGGDLDEGAKTPSIWGDGWADGVYPVCGNGSGGGPGPEQIGGHAVMQTSGHVCGAGSGGGPGKAASMKSGMWQLIKEQAMLQGLADSAIRALEGQYFQATSCGEGEAQEGGLLQ